MGCVRAPVNLSAEEYASNCVASGQDVLFTHLLGDAIATAGREGDVDRWTLELSFVERSTVSRQDVAASDDADQPRRRASGNDGQSPNVVIHHVLGGFAQRAIFVNELGEHFQNV